MEKKRVIIGGPIAIAGMTLILVTRLSFSCQPSGGGIFFSGTKQPVKVVVASPSAKQAFKVGGGEIPLDKLLQEVPGLAEVLEKT